MNKENLLSIFSKLGNELQNLSSEEYNRWQKEAEMYNKWFTSINVRLALDGIIYMLQKPQLEKWLSAYTISSAKASKKIGVLMAGNIPMVGFHDMLCVLISGNHLFAKLSSDDAVLLKKIAEKISSIDPLFKDKIHFVDRLSGIDALIATGSDNTAKHFEYYFSKIPKIIRRNRVSVAVLTGKESDEELTLLGNDILQYYGLGCRNVSKIFIPKDMTLNKIYEAIEHKKEIINDLKYNNNYEYNRSIYLLKSILHLDNGFLITLETEDLISPIAVLYYEKYESLENVKTKLESQKEKIQCIVSKEGVIVNSVPFGSAQCPMPWDYADNVDTLEFLVNLN